MPSAMHRLSAAASSMTAMIQFIKRQIVILEEIQCFLLGARVVLAQQERFVQERCQRECGVFGDEAHTRRNIEKMLEYENKSGQTTVRPDGCFEIVFQA